MFSRNILVEEKNLVFQIQGDVEAIASQSPNSLMDL